MGQDWKPYQAATFVTPPFPEYVSGHSGFSAAAAIVLRLYTKSRDFGYSVTIPARSNTFEPGFVPATDITLRRNTFKDAADQAGLSRRYGGIHFEEGDLRARRLGRQVGHQVWRKVLSYLQRTEIDRPVCDDDENESQHAGMDCP